MVDVLVISLYYETSNCLGEHSIEAVGGTRSIFGHCMSLTQLFQPYFAPLPALITQEWEGT